MGLWSPYDWMSCCFGNALECGRGFWTELTAHRQQFCLEHGRLIHGRMVLLQPTLPFGLLCRGGRRERNRSGSENLTLAIQSPHSIPYRHGNTACHTPRHVGTAPARSASLYSGTGSACGGIGGHGAGVTRAQPRLAGAAEPDLAELLPPTIKRPAPQRAATPSSEYTPSWWSTGPSWPYPHPCACGRSR